MHDDDVLAAEQGLRWRGWMSASGVAATRDGDSRLGGCHATDLNWLGATPMRARESATLMDF
ncbi:hypothetical protein SESBI_25927 [Sesbania bispinosa]|nr:hypothetical protein SESBI_25927 [Sesbania bispinosa]